MPKRQESTKCMKVVQAVAEDRNGCQISPWRRHPHFFLPDKRPCNVYPQRQRTESGEILEVNHTESQFSSNLHTNLMRLQKIQKAACQTIHESSQLLQVTHLLRRSRTASSARLISSSKMACPSFMAMIRGPSTHAKGACTAAAAVCIAATAVCNSLRASARHNRLS